jgi:hypothetical protein
MLEIMRPCTIDLSNESLSEGKMQT